jgi:hypothetical protein
VNLLLAVVGTIAGYAREAQLRWRCVRHHHRMIRMSDGPICGDCGRSWIWTERVRLLDVDD